jgi:hypothetical protein
MPRTLDDVIHSYKESAHFSPTAFRLILSHRETPFWLRRMFNGVSLPSSRTSALPLGKSSESTWKVCRIASFHLIFTSSTPEFPIHRLFPQSLIRSLLPRDRPIYYRFLSRVLTVVLVRASRSGDKEPRSPRSLWSNYSERFRRYAGGG